VAVYIRWSTEEQGLGTTLEVQWEACEHYCKSQGWTFRPEWVFVDEGYTGATLDRPALGKLRTAIREGPVDGVVVYKLDRLSRNLLDCVSLVRKEWRGRCALFSTKENFDTESPVGQMVFNILVSFAEFERNIIRDRTQSGKRKRAEQGRNAGQVYPYGYRKGPNGEWELDGWDEERQCFTGRAAIVRRIFDDYLSGISTRTIAERLRQEGILAPKGGTWRYNTISALLSNPSYGGTYTYGKRRAGERHEEPLLTVEGAFPPIVSKREWKTVQRLRTERAAQPPRALGSEYLLSGIIRCGKCGGTLAGAGRVKDPRYRYYTCTNRIFLRNCDCAYIDANKLEAAVLAEVRGAVSLEAIHLQVQENDDEPRKRAEQGLHAMREAQEVLGGVERKRKRLDQEFFAGHLDGKTLARLNESLDKEHEEAQRRLTQARSDLRDAKATTVDADQLVELSRRVDAWAELSKEELKQVLRDVIGSMTVYQQKLPTRDKKGNQNPIDTVWQPKLIPYGSATQDESRRERCDCGRSEDPAP